MERRSLVGMVVLAAVGVGLAGGCETQKRKNNPYITDFGKAEAIEDTPTEVQEFIKASYPDAQVERVYEMRHRKNYSVRHFEVHMILPGGRKKVVDYNVWQRPTYSPAELGANGVNGDGTSPGAQMRGESEGKQ